MNAAVCTPPRRARTSRPGSSRPARLAALAVLVALTLGGALTGCTGDSSPGADPKNPDSKGTATNADGPIEPTWTTKGLNPIGQPVDADGVAVLYTRSGKSVSMVGIDPANGKILWRHEATPSWTTTGVAMTPVVVGSEAHRLVALYAPDSKTDLLANLLVLDPHTGQMVDEARGRYFSTWPASCHDGTAVCAKAFHQTTNSWGPMRLDLRDGSFASESSPAAKKWPDQRDIGPDGFGLVDTGARNGQEEIARVVDGKALWHVKTRKVFGPRATTDKGWAFRSDTKHHVVWGYVGYDNGGSNGVWAVDLTAYRTAGFDADTGKVLWTAPHTAPCVDSSDVPPVRCAHASGTVIYQDGAHAKTLYRHLDTTLEGFDATTGKTTWSIPLGDDHTLVSSDLLAKAGPTEAVIHTPSGALVVNLADGTHRPAAPLEVFGCLKSVTFDYKIARPYNDQQLVSHAGGRLASLCDVQGKAVTGKMTRQLVGTLGTTVGKATLVATAHALAAYPA